MKLLKEYKMAIRDIKDRPNIPREIDLTGPDGNVFMLMAKAKDWARQIWGGEMTEELLAFKDTQEIMNELGGESKDIPNKMGDHIVNQMTESDYDNALEVFDSYFGSFVTMYR